MSVITGRYKETDVCCKLNFLLTNNFHLQYEVEVYNAQFVDVQKSTIIFIGFDKKK